MCKKSGDVDFFKSSTSFCVSKKASKKTDIHPRPVWPDILLGSFFCVLFHKVYRNMLNFSSMPFYDLCLGQPRCLLWRSLSVKHSACL